MKRFRPDLAADDLVRFNHDTRATQLWRCCDAFQNSTMQPEALGWLLKVVNASRERKGHFPENRNTFLCPESGLALSFATCCLPPHVGCRRDLVQPCPSVAPADVDVNDGASYGRCLAFQRRKPAPRRPSRRRWRQKRQKRIWRKNFDFFSPRLITLPAKCCWNFGPRL